MSLRQDRGAPPASPSRERSTQQDWLLPSLLAACLLLGGGGSPSPASEVAAQLLCALLLATALARGMMPRSPGRHFGLLCLLAVSLPLLQLIPLPPAIWQAMPGRGAVTGSLAFVDGQDAWRPLSVAPSRTLASLLALLPALAIGWVTATTGPRQWRMALVVLVVITLAATVLGAIQVATAGASGHPYASTHAGWVTGLFANRNHAADLFVIALVALAALTIWSERVADGTGKRAIVASLASLLAVALVMTGSRAGIAIGLALPVAAVGAYVLRRNARPGKALLVAGLALLALGIGGWLLGGLRTVAGRFGAAGDMRSEIWPDALHAAGRFWPWGAGIGTFEDAFAGSQRLETLGYASINRAHNDYLEFAIEAGLPGLAMLAFAAILLALRLRHATAPSERPFRFFATATLAALALHSLVDYPLRTMALAAVAAFAVGILAKREAAP